MPSKKLTAKKREEIKKKKTKQNDKNIIIPLISIILIIVVIVALGVYLLTGEDEKDINKYSKENNEPIAINDSFTVLMNASEIQLDILKNDNDSDGDIINIKDTSVVENGDVRIFNNKLYFTPNPGFEGNISFYYEIEDSEGNNATAKVDISVNRDNRPIAIIDTSKGLIKLRLFTDKVPNTCNNFIRLANENFYKGLTFHRILDDFMIQGGAYYPDGTIKQSPYGTIDLEINPDVRHLDGTIAMARANDPNSATSQFFICDGDQPGLDDQYAAFGIVIEGIQVVRDIADDPHDNSSPAGGGAPLTTILINDISIEYPLS